MIELMVALYLIFLGITVSLSAKTRVRFIIGVELQVLGIVLIALIYSSIASSLALLTVVAIALEALKTGAVIGLKRFLI